MWTAKKSPVAQIKLEEQVDQAWNEYSLDAPRIPNPVPKDTRDLRRMCMLIHIALPLAKMIIGAVYVNSCPTNDWLPTYMLVGGMLQLGFLVVLVYKPLRKPALLGCVGMFIVLWILIASVNIFLEWKPDFFLGGWRYCHMGFFYFCFFVSISEFVIISVLLLYVCTQFAFTRVEDQNVNEIV